MNLALLEIKLTVSQLLEKFTFELADSSMLDENIALESFLTLRPHAKLPVIVKLRSREKVNEFAENQATQDLFIDDEDESDVDDDHDVEITTPDFDAELKSYIQ